MTSKLHSYRGICILSRRTRDAGRFITTFIAISLVWSTRRETRVLLRVRHSIILQYHFSSFSFRSSDPINMNMDLLKDNHLPLIHDIASMNLIDQIDELPKNLQRNLLRPTRCLLGAEVWTTANEIYQSGTNNPNWNGGDLMDGGGPLTLTPDSVERFCKRLLPFVRHTLPGRNQIKIYWVGIGLAEEAILLVKYFEANHISVHVYAIELSRICIELLQDRIQRYKLSSSFTLIFGNFLSYKPNFDCDIIYTSAAVGPTFNLKLLHAALACHAKWVFLSNHCTTSYKRDDLSELNIEWQLWTKAKLSGSQTARNISIIFTSQFVNLNQIIMKSRNSFRDEIRRRIHTERLIWKWSHKGLATEVLLEIGDVINNV